MITEFRIGASHTFNLQNFNSYRVEASITVSVNEGDDYDDLMASAQSKLKEALTKTFLEQRRKDANR